MPCMDTSIRMPARISKYFNEMIKNAEELILTNGFIGFRAMMLDPQGVRTMVMIDWPEDLDERDHAAAMLRAIAVRQRAVAVCAIAEAWTVPKEGLDEDGRVPAPYSSLADHPMRQEVVSVFLTYRKGERLYCSLSKRQIDRTDDDTVVALEKVSALPEVFKSDGGGRLDTILSARTPNATAQNNARILLDQYPGFLGEDAMIRMVDKMDADPDISLETVTRDECERRAGEIALQHRGNQPIN